MSEEDELKGKLKQFRDLLSETRSVMDGKTKSVFRVGFDLEGEHALLLKSLLLITRKGKEANFIKDIFVSGLHKMKTHVARLMNSDKEGHTELDCKECPMTECSRHPSNKTGEPT